MKDNSVTLAGIEYVSHDCLVCGDYGGAGVVGFANIRYLENHFKGDRMIVDYGYFRSGYYQAGDTAFDDTKNSPAGLIIAEGGYGTRQAYIRTDLAEELVDGLDDYPLFDDSTLSEIEMEWEQEAWQSWVENDLYRTLSDELKDAIDALDKEQYALITWQAYLKAMESENVYPEPEMSSSYVNVDKIKMTYAANLQNTLNQ